MEALIDTDTLKKEILVELDGINLAESFAKLKDAYEALQRKANYHNEASKRYNHKKKAEALGISLEEYLALGCKRGHLPKQKKAMLETFRAKIK